MPLWVAIVVVSGRGCERGTRGKGRQTSTYKNKCHSLTTCGRWRQEISGGQTQGSGVVHDLSHKRAMWAVRKTEHTWS